MTDLRSGFLVGVNLPWLDYGCDFGTNAWQPEGGLARQERRQRLTPIFEALAARGIRAVRWFMLGAGRSGIRWAGDGSPLAPDDRFFPDVDSALDLARAHGLGVLFTLIDFLWFRRPRVRRGVGRDQRPVLLGEYPTAGSARSPESILARARESGYAGAFAWSVLAADGATGGLETVVGPPTGEKVASDGADSRPRVTSLDRTAPGL